MPLCQFDRGERMGKIAPSLKSFFFIVLISFIFSCLPPQLQKAQASGVYHLVKKHETVWSIARAYGVSVQDLVAVNKIDDVNSIHENSVLFIPSAERVIDDTADGKDADVGVRQPPKSQNDSTGIEDKINSKAPGPKELFVPKESPPAKNIQDTAAATIPSGKSSDRKKESVGATFVTEKKVNPGRNKFIWPVRGDVKARFGVQPNKTNNNWIKIVAGTKKKVKAAESGTVIFSSKLPVFGETMIIRHRDKFSTVYTHLKKRLVSIDKSVAKGDIIAEMGEKDEAGEIYMNFEIRVKGKACDPLLYLP